METAEAARAMTMAMATAMVMVTDAYDYFISYTMGLEAISAHTESGLNEGSVTLPELEHQFASNSSSTRST